MTGLGSLRTQLLIPLAICSIVSGVAVGVISHTASSREVQEAQEGSFEVIRETLHQAQYPLTPAVLQTLAQLTGTELTIHDAAGRRMGGTIAGVDPLRVETHDGFRQDVVAGYDVRSFARQSRGPGAANQVLVMYDLAKLRRARWAAAVFPLATGVCSTLVITVIAWWLSQRMIGRIRRLQANVSRVAAGDFSPTVAIGGDDELGQLDTAISKMAADLQTLWRTVHQQERQRLIHQLAAGMAHQLRNSLTGARMAIDLHAGQLDPEQLKGLDVARREIRRTEDYVQRILSLAAQQPTAPCRGTIADALGPVEESLQIIAKHHRVDLQWNLPAALGGNSVVDTASLALAVENLLLNAIEAGGSEVVLSASAAGDQLQIEVADNGPGPAEGKAPSAASDLGAEQISDDWFEPFVTSKPEGLGLGLSLVRRAAATLGGTVSCHRRAGWTTFTLTAHLQH